MDALIRERRNCYRLCDRHWEILLQRMRFVLFGGKCLEENKEGNLLDK